MEKRIQLTFLLENRIGALLEVLSVLAEAKSNIQAICISDDVHQGVLKLVTPDLKKTRVALKKTGIVFNEQQVYAINLSDRPGALAEVCAHLAESGINLDFLYGSTCTGSGESVLIVRVPEEVMEASVHLAHGEQMAMAEEIIESDTKVMKEKKKAKAKPVKEKKKAKEKPVKEKKKGKGGKREQKDSRKE